MNDTMEVLNICLIKISRKRHRKCLFSATLLHSANSDLRLWSRTWVRVTVSEAEANATSAWQRTRAPASPRWPTYRCEFVILKEILTLIKNNLKHQGFIVFRLVITLKRSMSLDLKVSWFYNGSYLSTCSQVPTTRSRPLYAQTDDKLSVISSLMSVNFWSSRDRVLHNW